MLFPKGGRYRVAPLYTVAEYWRGQINKQSYAYYTTQYLVCNVLQRGPRSILFRPPSHWSHDYHLERDNCPACSLSSHDQHTCTHTVKNYCTLSQYNSDCDDNTFQTIGSGIFGGRIAPHTETSSHAPDKLLRGGTTGAVQLASAITLCVGG